MERMLGSERRPSDIYISARREGSSFSGIISLWSSLFLLPVQEEEVNKIKDKRIKIKVRYLGDIINLFIIKLI
jgi:hypothetical protein